MDINKLDDDHLAKYASELALDVHRFTQNMSKHTRLSGEQSGVEGTPTFFINGVRYDESWDLDTLLRTNREYNVREGKNNTSQGLML